MNQTKKERIIAVLPKPVLSLLKYLWSFRSVIRPLKIAGPVVQIYINDSGIESFAGINNFYSFLLSDYRISAKVTLEFYDEQGAYLCRHQETIGNLASYHYSVKDIFKKNNVHSKFGIVTLMLLPKNRFLQALKKLGVTAPHFFMFYKSAGSMGHVHPSSVLDLNNKVSGEFISNQYIHSKGLEKIVFYQVNPSKHLVEIEHQLFDASLGKDRVLLAEKNILRPMSAICVKFDLGKMVLPEMLGMRVNPLPTSNSKPIVLRYYHGEYFSLSHS